MKARGVLFTALVTASAAVFLVQSLQLSPGSRLAPLFVIVPTLVFGILQLVIEGTSLPRNGLHALGGYNLLGTSRRVELRLRLHVSRDRAGARRERGLRLAFWGGLLVLLVYSIGLLPAVPLYLAPYLRVETRMRWSRAIGVAVMTAAAFYLIFDVLLHMPFPPAAIGWPA